MSEATTTGGEDARPVPAGWRHADLAALAVALLAWGLPPATAHPFFWGVAACWSATALAGTFLGGRGR
jgi:hypothetical protein